MPAVVVIAQEEVEDAVVMDVGDSDDLFFATP